MDQKRHILYATIARGHFTLVLDLIVFPLACSPPLTYNGCFTVRPLYVPVQASGMATYAYSSSPSQAKIWEVVQGQTQMTVFSIFTAHTHSIVKL